MAFPADPLDVVTEMGIGTWVDVSDDVLLRDRITITRGQADEGSQVDPSKCRLSLRNNGDYSPRNPSGAHYGLLGLRNTPLRVSVRAITDAFARTSVDSWGSADTGETWTAWGAGGTVSDSDFQVGSGAGTHSVPVANAYRVTVLEDVALPDVDAAVTFTLPFSDVTGGAVEPANVLLRYQDTVTYYMARVTITTAEAVQVELLHSTGGSLAGPVTVTGLTHSSAQALRIRAQAEGQALRAKVWAVADGEPLDWQVTVIDDTLTLPGGVGVRSGVAFGNTNTVPIVVSYDDVEVRLPRFAGEIASLPSRWDVTGHDVWTPVEAAGIGRRLNQGTKSTWSAMRRTISSHIGGGELLEYWPAEDGERSLEVASAIPSHAPMTLGGTVDFAAYTSAVFASGNIKYPMGQDPLPLLTSGSLAGSVTAGASSPVAWAVALSTAADAADTLTEVVVARWFCSGGTYVRWDLQLSGDAGSFGVNVVGYDSSGAAFALLSYSTLPEDVRANEIQVDAVQSGGNISARLLVGHNSPIVDTVLTAGTIDRITRIEINPDLYSGVITVGHVRIWDTNDPPVTNPDIATLADIASYAWVSYYYETSGARLVRLCAEAGIPLDLVGSAVDTAQLGAQRSTTLPDLITEAADADLGILYEPRGSLGLAYRTRTSLYNQTAVLALDYTAQGEVAPPLEPQPDDDGLRNDITVRRTDGASARQTLEAGDLSVQEPPDGVGRYDVDLTAGVAEDVVLPDLAGWRLHLGTWDEERYPVINVDLAALAQAGKTTLMYAAAALDVGDRLTVANPPAWLPPDTIDQLARGYTEVLGVYDWDLAVNCTPARPYQVAEADADTRADTDGSELAAGITSTATTLTVSPSSTETGLWVSPVADTEAGADFPLDILVGGERIQVGAVGEVLNTNPWMLTTISPWTVDLGTATVARSTAVQYHTAYGSGLLTPTGASASISTQGGVVAASASTSYFHGAWVYGVGALTDVTIAVNWFSDAGGTASISTSFGTTTSISAGEWTWIANTSTSPVGTQSARLRVRVSATPTTALYFTAATLIPTSTYDSDPQTMTVVARSANGVVKAHDAGTAVAVAEPAYVPL